MNRIRVLFFLPIFLLSFVANTFAFTVIERSGNVLNRDPEYSVTGDYYVQSFDGTKVKRINWYSFTDATYTQSTWSKTAFGYDFIGQHYFRCNTYYEAKYLDDAGNQLGYLKFHATGIKSPVCEEGEDGGSGSGNTGSGSGCATCEIFSCPGWSQYMQGLEDIKNAIPKPPNWQMVANTFRDTIAPRIKADMEDLFGYAPDPPAVPNGPAAPDLPGDLDARGLTESTGQEAPGLGESTFSPDDIKGGAQVIPERQDPTGGFNILDPVAGLPSQEEFMANLPNEGNADLPANPSEGDNMAPMPGDTTDTAPLPNDDSGMAPIPSESGIAPIPGDSGGSFPLPNENWLPPIPGR